MSTVHLAVKRAQGGFTLIELMIVVVVIAILSAIAYPSYTDYLIRGRIAEATANLSDQKVKLEQFFQDNRTYEGAACAPPAGTVKYFNFACTEQTANSFTIQATGIGAMAGFNYTIDESGSKSSTGPTGWAGSANCWAIKKDGSC